MELGKCLLTNNSCYKKGTKIVPKGIVVHSTGANNPNLKRYVQPDDGILGNNIYNNDWNRSGLAKCVHAFIGKDKNGVVRCYQTLPFNYAAWGVGKGKKGSYNNNPGYIQFEICEDNLKNEEYFNQAFSVAIEFCAYLCKEYKIPIENVVSHHESYLKGYGCNHADCDHWLKKFNKDMNWFRNEVNKKINNKEDKPTANDPIQEWTVGKYKILVAKYLRKSTDVISTNLVKYTALYPATKKQCQSKNSYAQFKIGENITITKIINKDGRVWGEYADTKRYIVLCNKDGTPQAKKVN